MMNVKAMGIGMTFLEKYFSDGSVKRKSKFIIGTVEVICMTWGKILCQ